jgi:3-oxoadipate enol-lactonase
LHPLGNGKDCWQFIDRAGAAVHLFPGHGDRPLIEHLSVEDLADDVVNSHAGTLDLIGVGMGGVVAQFVLVRHPDRVSTAVIAASGPWPAGDVESPERAARWATEARRRGMVAIVDEVLRHWFTPHAVRYGHPGVDYLRKTLLTMNREAWAQNLDALRLMPNIDRLAAVRQPVTLIAASHDQAVPPDGPTRLHSVIPNSRMAFVAAPHMLHLEQPRHFETEIARHFMWSPIGNRVELPVATAGE